MNHKEAFALMWYGCECGHRERIWNSRDGVTPFGMACPSCGDSTLQHVYWGSDEASPHHKPHEGQRVWIAMTEKAAIDYVLHNVKVAAQQNHIVPPDHIPEIIKSMYDEGRAPDLRIEGYERKL